jgi:hypothetical protein
MAESSFANLLVTMFLTVQHFSIHGEKKISIFLDMEAGADMNKTRSKT